MAILPPLQEIGFEASERFDFSHHSESVAQHNTRNTAAIGQSKSGPRSAARSSPCKHPQQGRRGKKGHSCKTGSKSLNSAERQSQTSKESSRKPGECSAKQRQEHSKDTAAKKSAVTKSKRAKSFKKTAPRRKGHTPSAESAGAPNPATTAKKHKKKRWIVPPALKKLCNKSKGAGSTSTLTSNSCAAITGQ